MLAMASAPSTRRSGGCVGVERGRGSPRPPSPGRRAACRRPWRTYSRVGPTVSAYSGISRRQDGRVRKEQAGPEGARLDDQRADPKPARPRRAASRSGPRARTSSRSRRRSPGAVTWPPTLDICTIVPLPWRRMWRQHGPGQRGRREEVEVEEECAAPPRWSPRPRPTCVRPALLTSTSMRPKRSTASCHGRARAAPASVTSSAATWTRSWLGEVVERLEPARGGDHPRRRAPAPRRRSPCRSRSKCR